MQIIKSIYKKNSHNILTGIAGIAMLSSMSSCESLYDEQGDCDPHYYLSFVYDMNMLYNSNHQIGADAFSSQVGSVDVYLFDSETGNLAAHYEEQGEILKEYGYKMTLDVTPGKYDIIAWCGLADNEEHFKLSETIISAKEDLKCKMIRNIEDGGNSICNYNLNPVFHGKLTVDLPEKEGEYQYTCYLTKDTNYIELALQHRSGALDPDRFTISMEDTNGHLAHDNSLLGEESITYFPWVVSGGTVDMGQGSRSEEEGTGFLIAELATSRLMANHNPILKVTDKETGNTVFSIPFVEWALLFKSARHSQMGDQEYLDREYEYNVMVILENDEEQNDGWLATDIVINGWHKIDNGGMEL